MIKNIFILLATVLFISCQDNKTKSHETENQKEENQTENKIKTEKEAENFSEESTEIKKIKQEELIPFLEEYGKENPQTKALIKTEFGEIELQLFEDTPLHRANFIYMANLGYFNTTYFYRVEKNFVIQAGNSDNDITAKMRKSIGSFLIPKEFKDQYKNKYGTLAAAKYSKQNVSKASSPYEFYIVMDKEGAPHLDQEHTVFGKVVKGMEVAEKIAQAKTENNSYWPVQNIEIEVEILE